MRNWIIFGIVLLLVGLLLHYPWNAIIIVFLAFIAFIRYRRQKEREDFGKHPKGPIRPTPKPGKPGGAPAKSAHQGYVRIVPRNSTTRR